MEIVTIISEWKRSPRKNPIRHGMKRVEAIVREGGRTFTKHLDIAK